eukprot:TRINITY_DN23815_c0_g1_i1.p1 TRINITY_DN23815_c0_g1~~TRINITY_DN23815_c0_g1_i1.p1  ORF type:complete len:1180 (-),score=188.82 TRINITY_DN23815_c0_g1_i1:12-3551(-)
MAATAFDLLRSVRRRSREAGQPFEPTDKSGTCLPRSEGHAQDVTRTRGPIRSSAVGFDSNLGVWWQILDSELLFFAMPGPQWPPCSVLPLPADVSLSARCVAPLTAPIQQGPHAPRGPSAVAIFADMRVAMFPQGNRVDLPRPSGALLGQTPSFMLPAASHPVQGVIGVVLVVGTRAGRLFTLFIKQNNQEFEIETGSMWPCSPGLSSFQRLIKRVRRSLPGMEEPAPPIAQEVSGLVHHAKVLPPPSGIGRAGALFALLAWSDEQLSLYVHPRSTEAADLLWTANISQLVAGGPSSRLLSVHCCASGEADSNASSEEALLLLYTGQDQEFARQSSLLARLPWPSRAAPPLASEIQQSITVGPLPPPEHHALGNDLPIAFLTAFGEGAVTAVKDGRSDRYAVCMVRLADPPAALRAGEQQLVDADIVGLALLPEGGASGQVQVLTPHGLLSCPQEMPGDDASGANACAEQEAKSLSTPDTFVQVAHELYITGREDQSTSLCARAFSQHGAQAMLAAVERHTKHLLEDWQTSGPRWVGVSIDAITRHMLYDKARDLERWLCFLDEAGFWMRMGSAPNIVTAQQNVAEACERVAACSKLREFHDRAPEVFCSAIHRISQETTDENDADSVEAQMQKFYSHPAECDRLLTSLAEYPRTLPLGSGGAYDAVLFVANVATGFLEAAVERRNQILTSHPTLLPPPEPDQTRRYLPNAIPPVAGVGSSWLVSPSILKALEQVWLVSLEVLPCRSMPGLPLLDAQTLRVVDGLQKLCRSILRAAHATCADLHCTVMAQIRRDSLRQLAEAETCLAEDPAAFSGPQRALMLAEEFEDFEAVVMMSAISNVHRLEEHMEKSEPFRAHAFAHCLRHAQLHPLFFRLLRLFPPRSEVLDELLRPYPEIQWTLSIRNLNESCSSEKWMQALQDVGSLAQKTVLDHRCNVKKRNIFVALASISSVAMGRNSQPEDPAVADLASIGRLQRLCHRFGNAATRMSEEDQFQETSRSAMSERECLSALCDCVHEALVELCEQGAETQLLVDAARLVRLVERGLTEKRVDLTALLPREPSVASPAAGAGSLNQDAVVVGNLQKLWAEVIMADAALWKQLLTHSPDDKRDALVAGSGFYRMLTWRGSEKAVSIVAAGSPTSSLPRSAGLDELCGSRPELRPFQPVLRVAEMQASAAKAA